MRAGVGPSYLVTVYREEVPKMTTRMISALAGLGLMATTLGACSTLGGAALGAGAGAAVGAGTGYGAGKGALIGTGVGAAAGAIYGVTKK
jgi:hypothetical protein